MCGISQPVRPLALLPVLHLFPTGLTLTIAEAEELSRSRSLPVSFIYLVNNPAISREHNHHPHSGRPSPGLYAVPPLKATV